MVASTRANGQPIPNREVAVGEDEMQPRKMAKGVVEGNKQYMIIRIVKTRIAQVPMRILSIQTCLFVSVEGAETRQL